MEENKQQDKQKVIIYTDGASSGNPGPGGWGAILKKDNEVTELGGGNKKTTNNRMEMKAAIEALRKTSTGDGIDLYTDSKYLINGITQWIFGWLKNDWKTRTNSDVLNKDLWQELYEISKEREINWIQVSGHAGIKLNNRADQIAVIFSKYMTEESEKPDLFEGNESDYEFEVKAPTKEELSVEKTNSKNKGKAYSYVSLVEEEIKTHKTWDECKKRVEGKSGVKFRKVFNQEEEKQLIDEWSQ